MRTKLVFVALWLLSILQLSLNAQTAPAKIKVYLLGTFHFAQTDSAYDVLTEKNQADITKLCEIIKNQKPDKIFIERMPEFEYMNKMDSLYQAYNLTDTARRRNEIRQVAFRVAKELGHKTVYSCDHPGQYGYYYGILEEYAGKNDQVDMLNYIGPGITKPASVVINADSLLLNVDLLEYMRWLNSKEVQSASHAHYINLYPQLGNTNVFEYDSTYFMGAELTADWYRRNIKIYSKMITQLDYTENAIFLIMGNDHIPIIRHLFESNPYFEVVDTELWLGRTKLINK